MIDRRIKNAAAALLMALTATAVSAAAQDNDAWTTKGKYEYHVYKLHPTEWPQGQAVPAEKCGMTPAQAAKYQCKTVTYEGRPYFYYEGEHGSVYARRPVVQLYETPGAPVSK